MAPHIFVSTIDLSMARKLRTDLEEKGFFLSQPPYTLFSARKPGVNCTLYSSGKLVVQGSEIAPFIEFYLEPEILQSLPFTYKKEEAVAKASFSGPYIGVDESGKGDFFGPLCIAGVCVDEAALKWLAEQNVCDSKKLSDSKIATLAEAIAKKIPHNIMAIAPAKYNDLYAKFGNLNHLLAWGHATVIENLHKATGCNQVLIDQFASEHVVLSALRKKNIDLTLQQRHRAEEDLAVAAASILARHAFVQGIHRLEEQFGQRLPKGASKEVISAGKQFVASFSPEKLKEVAKLHFKTTGFLL
jgi:ribonuclease HIII